MKKKKSIEKGLLAGMKQALDLYRSPNILIFDIETSLMECYTFGIFDQFIPPDDIKKDWEVIAWAAKLHDPTGKINHPVMYMDQRKNKTTKLDKKLLKGIHKLLEKCDIVITQNGKSFDVKKLNAKFVEAGLEPLTHYKHIDTKIINKKYFGFTSNSLAYLSEKLNLSYKKQRHSKYPGKELWKECEKGNQDAYKEMEKYNKYDVLSLEALYKKVIPWDGNKTVNFNVYNPSLINICKCGSRNFKENGSSYEKTGVFKRYKCKRCGAPFTDKSNLMSKDKKKALTR